MRIPDHDSAYQQCSSSLTPNNNHSTLLYTILEKLLSTVLNINSDIAKGEAICATGVLSLNRTLHSMLHKIGLPTVYIKKSESQFIFHMYFPLLYNLIT